LFRKLYTRVENDTFTAVYYSVSIVTGERSVIVFGPSSQPEPTINYSYIIKLINPTRMSEYKNVEIQGKAHCSSTNDLKEFVSTNHPSGVDMPNLVKVEMGYIEPGHGGKGTKV